MGLLFGKTAYGGKESHRMDNDCPDVEKKDCTDVDCAPDAAGQEAGIHISNCCKKREEEHYDGKTVEDVFREKPFTSKTSFIETRNYLRQIRDHKRRIGLLEERIGYNRDAGLGTVALENDLAYARHLLKVKTAEVVEEISRLDDVNLETVFIRRYVDLMSWDEIAVRLDFRMRSVLNYHGAGLPRLEAILLADGRIEMETPDHSETENEEEKAEKAETEEGNEQES